MKEKEASGKIILEGVIRPVLGSEGRNSADPTVDAGLSWGVQRTTMTIY